MNLKIYQVDAFTSQLFGGNPAAVVPLTEWLADDILQNIATENNLSETAFFLPIGEQYALRWFTPTAEVNLCGHATLATAHIIYKHLGYKKAQIQFSTHSGILAVEKTSSGYTMNFPTDQLEEALSMAKVLEETGIYALSAYAGRDDLLVEVDSEKTVAQLNLDMSVVSKIAKRGLIVTAQGETVDFVSRCFFPNYGIDEDPVTGSAHTTLTPFWAHKLGKNKLSARQISARGGAISCELQDDRTVLSGQAVTYLVGDIFI